MLRSRAPILYPGISMLRKATGWPARIAVAAVLSIRVVLNPPELAATVVRPGAIRRR